MIAAKKANANGKRVEIPALGTLPQDQDAGSPVVNKGEVMTITYPNFKDIEVRIRGTAPFVQLRFSTKSMEIMMINQEAGSTSRKGKKREPKDFDQLYLDAMYESVDGHRGFPAPSIRNASITACKIVGFKMTLAKLGLFTVADGYDSRDGTPLVYFTKGEPRRHVGPVRLPTGVADIRCRAMWDAGWESMLRIRFDADMFTSLDVSNLLTRVGQQVGIGEGRPASRNSAGMGWGLFELVN